jgi:exodeoxyribonuclease V gamma subunit
MLTEHPLHAFSPRYFSTPPVDERFFSYSEANAEASRSISAPSASEMPAFITDPLPQIEEMNHNLELGELIDFWGNPSRYFVRRRLGLTLRNTGYSLSENEPFHLSPLDKYPIRQELLTKELEAGQPLSSEVLEAGGLMPPGVMGELELRSMRVEIQKLAPIVQAHIGGGTKDESVPIDLELDEFRLSGKLNSVYGGRSVHFRTAKLNPKDHLRAWIEHLALCATSQGKESKTVLIGRDAVVTFRHVSTSHAELRTLCELFLRGLLLPLPFFPASGIAFVEAELSRSKDPFAKARSKWNGLWRQTGEKDNVFIARCFDVSDPLDDRFAELARRVLTPMLQHATREEL